MEEKCVLSTDSYFLSKIFHSFLFFLFFPRQGMPSELLRRKEKKKYRNGKEKQQVWGRLYAPTPLYKFSLLVSIRFINY